MKPKRKPVFLVTLLVTALVVVAGLNMTNVVGRRGTLRSVESPNAEALKKALKRDQEAAKKKNENYGSLAQLKSQGEESGITGAVRAGMLNVVPEKPTILIPRASIEAPKYQPGRTSGQWYSQDSYEKTRAEARGQ